MDLLAHVVTLLLFFWTGSVFCDDDKRWYQLLDSDVNIKNERVRRETWVNSSVSQRNENERNTINTRQKEDFHIYYTSKFFEHADSLFVDLTKPTAELPYQGLEIRRHKLLSDSYLKADMLNLKFPFYFYGNKLNSVVVTTGGFISAGPLFHAYAHMVHYVAPLMANFNPSKHNTSEILIGSGNDVFIVQWKDVLMNDSQHGDEKFNFEAMLFKNGTILFVYKDIPVSPIKLANSTHNVTIGVSDGLVITYQYVKDGKLFFHNYIYSYHKVSLPLVKPKSNTAYRLDLQPTCIQQTSCGECLDRNRTRFDCKWCEGRQLCSNSIDWHRQEWLKYCQRTAISDASQCGLVKNKAKRTKLPSKKRHEGEEEASNGAIIGGIIGFLLVVLVVVAVGFFYYAYTHPQSKYGMWLIEHRPARVFRKARFDKVPDDQLL